MNHNFAVWEGESFSFCPSTEQDCSHRSSQTDSDGGDVAFYVLHRVVESESTVDFSAGTVDVHRNVFARVLFLEKEDLCDDGIYEA